MPGFQRARSDEQRAQRREVILDTAAGMLTRMPVAQLSLNELSRQVGLAKSNVLRYFESREAVLLELLNTQWQEWLGELEDLLPDAVDPDRTPAERSRQLAAALATSLAGRPVFCDLIGAQAAVLERNVSAEVAGRYKRAAVANVTTLAGLVHRTYGELAYAAAGRFAAAAVLVTGSIWIHAQPSAAMELAYEQDRELAAMRLDFTGTLREMLDVLLAGLLVRQG